MNLRSQIDDFLSRRRLAMVGVSRNPKDFSRVLLRELRARGYDIAPVNPQATEVEGLPCFAHVQDITPPPEGALLMTAAAVTGGVVRDCAAAGVPRIWMYRAGGKGAVHPEAVDFCRAQGIDVIAGECPFMFLPGAAWPHRLHGVLRKITGTYPRADETTGAAPPQDR